MHGALPGDLCDLCCERRVEFALDPDDALEAIDLAVASFLDLAAIRTVIGGNLG